MKNLSTDPITDGAPLTPVERTFFDDLAKEASYDPATNESESVSGTNPVGEEADAKAPETPSGPVFSNAARREFIKGREKLLEELLPGASAASDSAEQKLVAQQFETPQYETSSPQLNKGASIETLAETVRRVIGRS
jgi:hypothetical protein